MIKNVIVAFACCTFTFTGFNSAATGCGSYDYWLKILKLKRHAEFNYNDEFEIMASGDYFIRIRMKKNSNLILTLPLQAREMGSLEWKDVRLVAQNAKFEEGNGCDPVYICESGQYLLKLPAEYLDADRRIRVFAWPVLREYVDHRPQGWAAGDLLPPFSSQISPTGGADLTQCDYGNW